MIKILVKEFTASDYERDSKKYCPMVYVSPNTAWYNFVIEIYFNNVLCDTFDLSRADSKPSTNDVLTWLNGNNVHIGKSIVNLLKEADKQKELTIEIL